MSRLGKKLLAILLCAVMGISVAACGSANPGRTETGSTQAVNSDGAENAGEQGAETQTAGTNVTAKGRYMESPVALPEGAGWQARSMALLSDGALAYFDAQIGLHSSGDEGKTWTQVRDISKLLPKGAYIMSAAIAPDQSMTLVYSIFSERKRASSTVALIASDGSLTETNAEFDGGGDYIEKTFRGPDGQLYGLSITDRICRIDMQSGKITQLFAAAGGTEMLAFSGKKLLALENEGVEIYDLEQGMLNDSDPVLDEFVKSAMDGMAGTSEAVAGWLLDGSEGVIYMACRDGVYRHVLGGNAMEQLIDGNYSIFGDPTMSMYSLLLLESGEFLLLSGGEELVRFTYDPNQPAIPEKQLRVYSFKENIRVRQAISTYQKQNPDVFVKYETGLTEGSAVTAADAQKNLNVELMSGKGPDVLILDGLDEQLYAQKGMLRDLSGILDSLTGENALFDNIAGAYRTENGIFVIPTEFGLNMIAGKPEDINGIKDLKSLADAVEELRSRHDKGTITGCYTPEWLFHVLVNAHSTSWLNGRELNTDKIADFLTQAKRIYDADMAGADPAEVERLGNTDMDFEYMGIGNMSSGALYDDAHIGMGLAKNMLSDMGHLELLEKEYGFTFDLWNSESGKGFIPANKLAIAANTAQPELAEAFVKLMLSPDIQDVDMALGFPVNISSFDRLCATPSGMLGFTIRRPDGTEVDITIEHPGKETQDKLKKLVLEADHNLEGNAVVKEAVVKYGTDVLKGSMTVEEGVAAIQKSVSIYLSE